MEKTNNFFVIHNFNTVPEYLLEYCNDYIIFDASTDNKVTEELKTNDELKNKIEVIKKKINPS